MILIDTNLWLWSVVLGVVRASTQGRLMRQPLSAAEALDLVEGWLMQPLVQLVLPGADHWSLVRQLLHAVGSACNLTPDAHLAALAISSDSLLCSADNDFRRASPACASSTRWPDRVTGGFAHIPVMQYPASTSFTCR